MKVSNRTSSPEPKTILNLASAVYPSFAFLTGMHLDIFTVLDDRPLTIEETANALNVKSHLIERLLYALVSAGLLTVENGQFANTEEASHYLVKGKPSYMGNHVFVSPFLNYHIWGAAVKTAEIIRAGEIQKFDYSTASQEQLTEIFRSTMPIAIRSGEELAKKYDFTPYSTLADVGGASGGLAASLAKAYPHLEVTVTDLQSITPVTKILLEEQDASDVEVLTWNVLDGPCPLSFDAVVLRALIQVLSPEDARQAVINIGKSVNPGGAIFVLGHIMDDSKISPEEEVGWYLLNLHWDNEAGFYTEQDHRDMLQEAGFEDIERDTLPNGDGLMIARKP